jgi:hypothetical protein
MEHTLLATITYVVGNPSSVSWSLFVQGPSMLGHVAPVMSALTKLYI